MSAVQYALNASREMVREDSYVERLTSAAGELAKLVDESNPHYAAFQALIGRCDRFERGVGADILDLLIEISE